MAAYQLLIADDEPIVRSGLKNSVNWGALGFSVTGVFSGGHEVIHFLQENTADVILSDIRMPEGSGLELAEWVSRNRPGIDVVLLTGYTDYDAARKAINCSAVKYLINKPLSMEELRSTFRDLADKRGQHLREQEQISQMNLQYLRQVLRGGVSSLEEDAALACVAVLLPAGEEVGDAAPTLYSPSVFGVFHGLVEDIGGRKMLLYPCTASQFPALEAAAQAYLSMLPKMDEAEITFFSSPAELTETISHLQENTAVFAESRLPQAIDAYLQQHFTSKITLSDAARYLHYSTGYFSRKFKEQAQIGFAAYILGRRVEYAKRLLTETDKSIADIAAAVGFEDMRHFAQTFKRKTGMTPSAYRRLHPGEAGGK